jgi:hypothetical protein
MNHDSDHAGRRTAPARKGRGYPALLAGLLLALAGCSDDGGDPVVAAGRDGDDKDQRRKVFFVVATANEGNGALSPARLKVRKGRVAVFTPQPAANHHLAGISGCGGDFDGTTYTTAPVRAACTVSATFALNAYAVTAMAGANGSIAPAVVNATHGSNARFDITPDTNYLIAGASGCGGSLVGNEYVTGAVTGPCSVTVSFAPSYAIGGVVSGLAPGVALVLANNGEQLAVSASGAFAFATRYPHGGSYAVSIDTQPVGHECTVTGASGAVAAADVGSIQVDCVGVVEPLYPLAGANWNDYVRNDGADALGAGDVACAGNESGGPAACLHGGERRQFRVPAAASCAGLAASDALGAFLWRCHEEDGKVRFVSALKPVTRVADLIDVAGGVWRENSVVVRDGDVVVAASAPRTWWSNPLVVDNDGVTAQESVQPGTLYLVTENVQGSYILGADRTGLLVMPGKRLQSAGSTLVSLAGRKFTWVEGSFDAGGTSGSISLNNTRFSVLRHVSMRNSTDRGLYVVSSHNNRLESILLANNGIGLNLYSSLENLVAGLVVSGGNNGIINESSHDNAYIAVTAANNSSYGIYPNSSQRILLLGAVAANNGTGLNAPSLAGSKVVDSAFAHNQSGIVLNNATGNAFTGLLYLGGNSQDCTVSGGTSPGLVHGTCVNEGASDAVRLTGVSLAAAFVGEVLADDAANADDTGGYSAYPAAPAAFDWSSFANAFRSWGRDGGTFPAVDQRGRWTSGNGRIWDWSLAGTDAFLRDALVPPGGDDALVHTWGGGSSDTFLRHAREIGGDGDGLCESGETCLYLPNIGAYQGHGALVDAGAFVDGVVTGVTLLRYESNGR